MQFPESSRLGLVACCDTRVKSPASYAWKWIAHVGSRKSVGKKKGKLYFEQRVLFESHQSQQRVCSQRWTT